MVSTANIEQRIKEYKQILKDCYIHKDIYPEWYKEMVRDLKTDDEKWLKFIISHKKKYNL